MALSARAIQFTLHATIISWLCMSAAHADKSTDCIKVTPVECATINQTSTVWNLFVTQLAANKPQEAFKYIHSESRENFSKALLAPGAKTSDFAKSIRDFSVIEISPGYVNAALVVELNGTRQMFNILFCIDRDKSWKICSM